MSHEGVAAGTRLDVPDPDGRVQTPADDVGAVELERVDPIRVAGQSVDAFLSLWVPYLFNKFNK